MWSERTGILFSSVDDAAFAEIYTLRVEYDPMQEVWVLLVGGPAPEWKPHTSGKDLRVLLEGYIGEVEKDKALPPEDREDQVACALGLLRSLARIEAETARWATWEGDTGSEEA